MTPLIGNVLEQAGYDKDYSFEKKTITTAEKWEDVLEINGTTLINRKPVTLDFGAIGKGYLIDIVGKILEENSIASYCIDAGGDISDKILSLKNKGMTNSGIQRYFKEGGNDGQMRVLLAQSYYLGGEYASAAKTLTAEIHAEEKAGGKPTEDRLNLLASCYLKLDDMNGFVGVLEKLATYHPKKEYWADLLYRLQRKAGFSDRLSLDLYRLKLASGHIGGTGDYMEMAQLALQAGYPAEAKKIVDEGYARNLLGSGAPADVDRHKRLRDLITRQLSEDQKNQARDEAQANTAKEGTVPVNVGYNLVLNGQHDKGLALMEKGIAKGGLKRPEDAKLHLAHAYLLAGQKAKAIQAFKSVQNTNGTNSTDGTADLARLWLLQISP